MNSRISVWMVLLLTVSAVLIAGSLLLRDNSKEKPLAASAIMDLTPAGARGPGALRTDDPTVTIERIEQFWNSMDERTRESIERLEGKSEKDTSLASRLKNKTASITPSSRKSESDDEIRTHVLRSSLREAILKNGSEISEIEGEELVRWIEEINESVEAGRQPAESGLFLQLLGLFDRLPNDLKSKKMISAINFQRMTYSAIKLRESGTKVGLRRPLPMRMTGESN